MALLICSLTFLSIVVMVIALSGVFDHEQETVQQRLVRYASEGRKISLYHAEMEEPLFRRTIRPVVQMVMQQAKVLTPEVWRKQIAEKIYQAGNPLGITPDSFVLIQVLLVSIFPLFMIILTMGAGWSKAVLLGIVSFLIGILLPEYYLRVQARERTLRIQETLPDLLDLLTVSVEAGLGFDAALSKVVEKFQGPLTQEFKRLLQEIRIGKPRLEAFRDLGRRSGSEDLTTFCSAITQADQLGVSLGKVLRIQSEQMRLKRRQRAEEAALKAPIKIIFPMVILIFPALFIVLLGPAVIRIAIVFGGGGI